MFEVWPAPHLTYVEADPTPLEVYMRYERIHDTILDYEHKCEG